MSVLETALAVGGGLGGVTFGVVSYGAFHPRSRLFGPVIWRGPGNRPMLALTFDDGPTPGVTESILESLAAAGARATFFAIGSAASEHPDLVRRIHDEGHVVGCHSMDHHRLGLFRRDAYWRDQIELSCRAIESITGTRPIFFRPPMGFRSAHIMRGAHAAGCSTVTWSRRAFDTKARSAGLILKRIRPGLKSGAIIALHDGVDGGRPPPRATAEAVPLILEHVHQLGLQAVGLDELLEVDG